MTRLALVMVARDEARAIARALASARSHVDRMIVLDTGSADDTRGIARSCGAEVHEFAWRDDFAAARNAALSHSDADWNLILDADEWLDGGTEGLGARTLPAGEGGFLGAIRVRSLMDTQPGAASQACVGGYSSAPLVAAIYHPAMAPVGLLLAVLGNVVGTYLGLAVAQVLSGFARLRSPSSNTRGGPE